MHNTHAGLTVAVEIVVNDKEALRTALRNLSSSGNNRFSDSKTTLIATGVILPAQKYKTENDLPETLVFSTTYCGPVKEHLDDITTNCKAELESIFKYCKGFNSLKGSSADLKKFMLDNSHKSTHTSRFNYISKEDVTREKELRIEIEDYLDQLQTKFNLDNMSPFDIQKLIQRHIKTRGIYNWALKKPCKKLIEIFDSRKVLITLLPTALFLVFLLFKFSNCPICLLLTVVPAVILLVILLTILLLLYIGRKKTEPADMVSKYRLRTLAASQLHPVVNEMTATNALKNGKLRRHFYAVALRIINFIYSPQIPTVRAIRWLVINNKKRLVFISNYSNTTDFYVRDFLNGNTPIGVNFMFTNGKGFPDAKALVLNGIIQKPEEYMNAVHSGQMVADFWYIHEPDLTIDIINKNRRIRKGLFKKMNQEETIQWLRLF